MFSSLDSPELLLNKWKTESTKLLAVVVAGAAETSLQLRGFISNLSDEELELRDGQNAEANRLVIKLANSASFLSDFRHAPEELRKSLEGKYGLVLTINLPNSLCSFLELETK